MPASPSTGPESSAGPQVPDSPTTVSRRLVDVRHLADRAVVFLEREAFRHLEGIDADAFEQRQLVVEHVADAADFALVAQPRAQQPRPGERAPVLESRQFERDDLEAMHVVAKLLGRFRTPEADAQ